MPSHFPRLEIRERDRGDPAAAVAGAGAAAAGAAGARGRAPPMSPARLVAVAEALGGWAHHLDLVVHDGLLPLLTGAWHRCVCSFW